MMYYLLPMQCIMSGLNSEEEKGTADKCKYKKRCTIKSVQ